MFVWPGAESGEDYNPMNNLIYTHVNGAASWTTPATNESQFVTWCESINCTAIFQVPGEIDNTTIAAWVVRYTEDTLGFHPAFWEIGNEPELWNLFGVPWSQWPLGLSRHKTEWVSPGGYALLVQDYTIAMRGVDPNINIIGIPATGRANGHLHLPIEDWVANVTRVDGPNISGVAYHSYPAARGATDGMFSLPNFYGAINSTTSFVGRVPEIREGIANGSRESLNATCRASCSQRLGIFVTEFGSGLSHTAWGHWESSFPGALSFAAQVTQAMDMNLTNLDVFASVFNTNNSWLSLNQAVRPSYTMFSEILNHLGNEAFRLNLTTSTTCQCDATNTTLGSDLYGIATVDPSQSDRSDLMVVNLNATTNVTFTPSLPGIAPGTPTEVWEWQGKVSNPWNNWVNVTVAPMTPEPIALYFPHGLPVNWTLPLQTVAVFEAYPRGGVPIQFLASGFSGAYSNPRWYVDVNGTLETANNTDNLTCFIPTGPFPISISAPPIPLENGSPVLAFITERVARERLEPFLPSSIQVRTTPLSIDVSYVHQWATNISVASGPEGTVTPAPQWWNASTPLVLTARPAFHYAFTHWVGFGRGSNNRTDPQTTLLPTGWITEKAFYTWASSVTFTETGLPAGSPWSVTVHSHFDLNNTRNETNTTHSSVTNVLEFEEPNGSFGFNIGTVAGYRSSLTNSSYLTNSSVNVSGHPLTIGITFTPVTPPAPRYAVTFEETGLPTGTRWWLTTRNVTTNQTGNVTNVTVSPLNQSSETPTMVVEEANGSYGYNTSSIPGFRAHPPAFGYNVSGPGRVVLIQFSPVRYYVIWKEVGLGPNLSWSVTVDTGASTMTNKSVGAWTTFHLVNGTSYSFAIPSVADYVPTCNGSGSFSVNGANVTFNVSFPQVTFPVTFAVSSLPSGDSWQVRLSDNQTLNLSRPATTFRAPNGSYTFDVVVPPGYMACPSHGTITVDAAAIVINVSIVVDGPVPCPPIWNLACPAIVACAAITVVGVGTLLIGRTRRRRRSGGTS
jgi:hypothetical protein